MLHVRMKVQGKSQTAQNFAMDIEKYVLDEVRKVSESRHVSLDGNPSLLVTSDSNGRQTVVIQFNTKSNYK